jgi:uncharacterized protein YyaL (SSP411 family)
VNRLAGESSPYLLQHAGNPVDWYPWGEEALGRARAEDKPIFLSIGYSACHWCHVMERESFSVAATAELMNEHFVNVKVDREERPDIDALYMDAAVAMIRSGGWPLSLFLTPDGRPFWAGTYFPPVARGGLRGFPDILTAVADVWLTRRAEVEATGESVTEHLRHATQQPPASAPLDESVLRLAFEHLTESFDWTHGGWGTRPKFPAASVLEFLLRRDAPLRMAERTLDAMAAGGMYDLVGGGFHRYSVDERWLVPHFEKMLYDNAQLASCYLHGWLVLGTERYRAVAEQTVEYMLRELSLPGGGLASSQDADTDGEEGVTYTWTRSEGVPDGMLQAFEGNRFVLRGVLDDTLRAELFARREQRPKPARDDKAVASWNGLALSALAECGRYLERPGWLERARELAEFLLGPMSAGEGRLHRTWRAGVAGGTGYLDDYADVANGLIELHAATGEERWLEEAHRLAVSALELFSDDENGGFFQTPADGERLIVRRKLLDDHPTPSGNAMLAYVLLRLARIYGDDRFEERGVSVLALIRDLIDRAPASFGFGLVGFDFYLSPRRELAIVGPADSPIARRVLARFEPHTVVAFGPSASVPLLEGKTLVDGQPAVYVCERFACQAPVTDPEAF